MDPSAPSFRSLCKDADASAFAPPTKLKSFLPPQIQHDSAPIKSEQDVLDTHRTWSKDELPSYQHFQEEIRRFRWLSLNQVMPSYQQLPPPQLSWSESDHGVHQHWSWLNDSAPLSSSTVCELKSNSTGLETISSPQVVVAPRGRFQPHIQQTMDFIPTQRCSSSFELQQTYSSRPQKQPGARPLTHHHSAIPGLSFVRESSSYTSNVSASLNPHNKMQFDAQPAICAEAWHQLSPPSASLKLLATFANRSDFAHQLEAHHNSQHKQAASAGHSFFPADTYVPVLTSRSRKASNDRTEHTRGPSAFNAKEKLYKTEICRNWEEKGFCYYGDRCQFAHGEHELRQVPRNPLWKTKPCKRFKLYGSCQFAKRCCFSHDVDLKPEQAASVDRARRSSLLQRVGIVPSVTR